nr:MAG TPA: hypothetical protein [Caudoviricetes sp.]
MITLDRHMSMYTIVHMNTYSIVNHQFTVG